MRVPDIWYARPVGDFVPADHVCGKCGAGSFEKTEDILDVWFDSGCSHAAVLALRPQLSWPADLYIEGVDQHRGWFQVSLITATATRDAAPYRTVVTNGLTRTDLVVVMSKSLGNVENAADVVARVGADVMRLVFASVDYATDMRVGEDLFSAVSESYRKLRNTSRYMLGNLYDFDPQRDLVETSRIMLEPTASSCCGWNGLGQATLAAYQRYDFQAVYNALVNFAVIDLSSLTSRSPVIALYCSPASSIERLILRKPRCITCSTRSSASSRRCCPTPPTRSTPTCRDRASRAFICCNCSRHSRRGLTTSSRNAGGNCSTFAAPR